MNRCLASGAAALSALSLLLTARPSLADSPPAGGNGIYVLTIRTDDADDQADALTRALRARVKQAAGWSLLETNQSFETLAIALKCPPKPDPACLLRIGEQLHTNRYIWGTMERKKGPPGQVSADMHMWSRGKPGVETRGVFSDTVKDAGDEGLQMLAADMFNQLVGQPVPSASPPPVASAPPLAPAPAPAAAPSAQPADSGETISVGHVEPESKFSARKALTYSTLVLGAGFIAGAIVEAASWVSDSNASTADRQNVPVSVVDVCSSTSASAVDACNKSNDAMKASTLGWIFAGIGAGLVATGVSLLVTERPSQPRTTDEASTASKTRVDVLPSVGPRSGAVGVRVTF
ncbi:MAG TPA: hypothetical protein VGM06_03645 [Polyangiaceae bacterium]